jgi:UDP-N-acetylglucosamine--N-acetylmuramyl-(pentapeptide) pyrophosphoryl-undecaprenol N-acetylglucosamine transferase
MHETDSRSDRWSVETAKIADRISVSFPDTPKKLLPFSSKISHVGHPIRKLLIEPIKHGAREYLQLETNTPVLLFVGGSRGSQQVNSVLLRILPELVAKYHVIHQTGVDFYDDVVKQATSALYKNENADRYRAYPQLNELSLAMIAGIATVAISRAGSIIFEFAMWELPAVLVPEADAAFDYQKHNAYSYAHSGGAVVIESPNLEPHILLSEINRLAENQQTREAMQEAANSFSRPNAALVIARELVLIAKSHSKV